MSAESSPQSPKPVDVSVRYDDTPAKFANQVVVNGTREEIYLDFSAGLLVDQRDGRPILPIHTRIVMTVPGARRLSQALGQILANVEKAGTVISAGSAPKKGEAADKGGGIKASLPKI